MQNDETGILIIGMLVGSIVGFVVGLSVFAINDERITTISEAITECQSTLPRNQTCKYVITAVPEVAE